jgi:hypothetical protein
MDLWETMVPKEHRAGDFQQRKVSKQRETIFRLEKDRAILGYNGLSVFYTMAEQEYD